MLRKKDSEAMDEEGAHGVILILFCTGSQVKRGVAMGGDGVSEGVRVYKKSMNHDPSPWAPAGGPEIQRWGGGGRRGGRTENALASDPTEVTHRSMESEDEEKQMNGWGDQPDGLDSRHAGMQSWHSSSSLSCMHGETHTRREEREPGAPEMSGHRERTNRSKKVKRREKPRQSTQRRWCLAVLMVGNRQTRL